MSTASLLEGLVAHYQFNEGYGDVSGNGNELTVIGSPTLTADKDGNPNRAYTGMNNTNHFTRLSPVVGTTDFTISMWFQFNIDADFAGIFNIGSSSLIIQGRNKKIEIYSPNNTPGNVASLADVFTLGQWYHIILIKEGSIFNLYVDDVLRIPNVTYTHSISANYDPIYIGTGNHEGQPLNTIDEFRMYNRAVTSGEKTEIFNKGVSYDLIPDLTIVREELENDTIGLSWNAIQYNDEYKVLYKKNVDIDYTTIDGIVATNYIITGLDEDTLYDIIVESYDDIPLLITSGEIQETTELNSSIPISIIGRTTGSITISYTVGEFVTILYKKSTDVVYLESDFPTIIGLDDDTSYDIKIAEESGGVIIAIGREFGVYTLNVVGSLQLHSPIFSENGGIYPESSFIGGFSLAMTRNPLDKMLILQLPYKTGITVDMDETSEGYSAPCTIRQVDADSVEIAGKFYSGGTAYTSATISSAGIVFGTTYPTYETFAPTHGWSSYSYNGSNYILASKLDTSIYTHIRYKSDSTEATLVNESLSAANGGGSYLIPYVDGSTKLIMLTLKAMVTYSGANMDSLATPDSTIVLSEAIYDDVKEFPLSSKIELGGITYIVVKQEDSIKKININDGSIATMQPYGIIGRTGGQLFNKDDELYYISEKLNGENNMSIYIYDKQNDMWLFKTDISDGIGDSEVLSRPLKSPANNIQFLVGDYSTGVYFLDIDISTTSKILYTIDNTDPVTNGIEYTSEISLFDTTIVKAVVVKEV